MSNRVFIDGHAGTTGLRIRDWLVARDDLELLEIDEAQRKDPEARRECLEAADIAVLCLPDDAAAQAAEWLQASNTKILDASTAHRIADGWVYGLPELGETQRQAISQARLVSNPGCYPSSVILALRPLVDAGLVPRDAALSVHALSGYSGGGRQKIEAWEDPAGSLADLPYEAPYSLEARHKHLPEMTKHCALEYEPHFVPAVGAFACGMRVQLPLHASLLPDGVSAKAVWEVLQARYAEETFVRVRPLVDDGSADEAALDPRACNDTNRIELQVIGHEAGHLLLVAILDNLGKGAAGVAIQNLNRMLGIDEARGLSA
ncbi:MAG: N-acetyl-gamma-glutamyl-phosphate reductase [Myxococcota bacterium]